jgi:hypothetical protein
MILRNPRAILGSGSVDDSTRVRPRLAVWAARSPNSQGMLQNPNMTRMRPFLWSLRASIAPGGSGPPSGPSQSRQGAVGSESGRPHSAQRSGSGSFAVDMLRMVPQTALRTAPPFCASCPTL